MFQLCIQWNPSILATTGTKDFIHYRGVVISQEFYKYYFNTVGTKVSGHYSKGGRSSGVAIKRGSTVDTLVIKYPQGKRMTRASRQSISKLYTEL